MGALSLARPVRAVRLAVLRPLGSFTLWAAVGAAVALAVAAAGPRLLGWQSMTVLTGSMRPLLRPGDVVVDRMIAPASARPGDIVTFHDPGRGGKLVTHRVRFISRRGAMIDVVTRGDANSVGERWSVPADGRIGRVEYRIPHLGYLGQWVGTPLGRLLAIVLPALALAIIELRAVWRSPPAPDPGAEPAAP